VHLKIAVAEHPHTSAVRNGSIPIEGVDAEIITVQPQIAAFRHASVFPNASEREHLGEWNYLQTFKPFASDLMLSPERVRYMQQINLDFHIQNEMLPFDRVVDMSLARDAQKLLT
jgi:hypothetical protein